MYKGYLNIRSRTRSLNGLATRIGNRWRSPSATRACLCWIFGITARGIMVILFGNYTLRPRIERSRKIGAVSGVRFPSKRLAFVSGNIGIGARISNGTCRVRKIVCGGLCGAWRLSTPNKKKHKNGPFHTSIIPQGTAACH